MALFDSHATEAALERLRALAAILRAKESATDNDRIMLEAVLETLAAHGERPAGA